MAEAERPRVAYAVITAAYWAALGGVLALANRRGRRLPAQLSAIDLFALGLATYRLSYMIARERVTSTLRLPFIRIVRKPVGPEGSHEVPKGRGLQRALGELLTCTGCVGIWVGAALSYALVLLPRASRLFILATAAAGIGQIAEEAVATLRQVRQEERARAGAAGVAAKPEHGERRREAA